MGKTLQRRKATPRIGRTVLSAAVQVLAINIAVSQSAFAKVTDIPPNYNPMKWAYTFSDPSFGTFDCGAIPNFHQLILRYHDPDGGLAGSVSGGATQIVIAFQFPTQSEAASFNEGRTEQYVSEGCKYIYELYKTGKVYKPFGMPIFDFHPLGGTGGQASKYEEGPPGLPILPKKYLPEAYVKARGRDLYPGESIEVFGGDVSDDIVVVGHEYFYRATFNGDNLKFKNRHIVCLAPLGIGGVFSLPLSNVKCYFLDDSTNGRVPNVAPEDKNSTNGGQK